MEIPLAIRDWSNAQQSFESHPGRVERASIRDTLCNQFCLMDTQSAVDRTECLFFGRVSVMVLSFGTTPELEFIPGLGKIAKVSISFRSLLPFGIPFHSSTHMASMLSACKDEWACSSPHGHHQELLSGSNHILGQNSRGWERSPPSTSPLLRDQ